MTRVKILIVGLFGIILGGTVAHAGQEPPPRPGTWFDLRVLVYGKVFGDPEPLPPVDDMPRLQHRVRIERVFGPRQELRGQTFSLFSYTTADKSRGATTVYRLAKKDDVLVYLEVGPAGQVLFPEAWEANAPNRPRAADLPERFARSVVGPLDRLLEEAEHYERLARLRSPAERLTLLQDWVRGQQPRAGWALDRLFYDGPGGFQWEGRETLLRELVKDPQVAVGVAIGADWWLEWKYQAEWRESGERWGLLKRLVKAKLTIEETKHVSEFLKQRAGDTTGGRPAIPTKDYFTLLRTFLENDQASYEERACGVLAMAGGYIDAHRKRANEQTNFQPAIDIMIELVQTSPIRRVRWNAAYGLALDRSHWTFTPNQQAKLREVASKERDEGIHELLREALGEIPRR